MALEAGAEDVVTNDDGSVEVLADPARIRACARCLSHGGYSPATAEVTLRAATSLALAGEQAERMVRLLEALEDLDEVQDVYSNVEIPDEILARV